MPSALTELTKRRRAFGMTLRIEDRVSPTSVKHLLTDLGFARSEEELFSISRDEAVGVLSYLVAHDQAYGTPTDALDLAEVCVREFAALFPEASRFYTNSSDPIDAKSRSWNPLTEAAFDSGVLAVSANRVGVLWFEDED